MVVWRSVGSVVWGGDDARPRHLVTASTTTTTTTTTTAALTSSATTCSPRLAPRSSLLFRIQAIIYDRDFEFDYFGFKTLERSYLLKVSH